MYHEEQFLSFMFDVFLKYIFKIYFNIFNGYINGYVVRNKRFSAKFALN